MAKIYELKISNFRGINKFEQTFSEVNFICLIGRGDSGKSSILDAISYVLSSSWNLTFYDTDFHNANIEVPIEIEVTLINIPVKLLQESKYGLHIRGLDKKSGILSDNIEDNQEPVLTIKLIVDKDLEPKWFVYSNRMEPVEIRATDRSHFNVYLISDYIDRHFSWNKGNPLYSLLKQNEPEQPSSNVITNAFREAKQKIDQTDSFSHLKNTIIKVQDSVASFGVDISNTSTTIDFKDIAIKDGRICLHDEKIPFRLKGKGSKRLISIAIQTELAKTGGILLIDEIEQGLEPDRVQHLVSLLSKNNKGQMFITTHSRDVLVELNSNNLFKMRKGANELGSFPTDFQASIRANPEAFFADKVLVCEGPTEVGICRGINNFRISNGDRNAAMNGVRFADGKGDNVIEYAKAFSEAGYKVCVFCDSDVKTVNQKKKELIEMGIKVIDTEIDNSLEDQLFTDLPWNVVQALITYVENDLGKDRVHQMIEHSSNGLKLDYDSDNEELRKVLAKASVSKNNPWFKRTDHGEFVGFLCSEHLTTMNKNRLSKQFNAINNWIDND